MKRLKSCKHIANIKSQQLHDTYSNDIYIYIYIKLFFKNKLGFDGGCIKGSVDII